MKFPKSLALLLFVFLLTNCSKDETSTPKPDAEEQPKPDPNPDEPQEPESEVYFSLNVAEDYIYEANEEWIIIHDEAGNLLDYKMVSSGSTTNFESLDTDTPTNFTVTRFQHQILANGDTSRFFLTTYPNIANGSVWNYKYDLMATNEENPRIPGNFSIQVLNIPSFRYFTLSSLEAIFPVKSYTSQKWNSSLVIPEIELYETSNYYLSIVDGNNDLKYTLLENVQNSESLILNYNEFLNFDHYISIDLPTQEIEYYYLIGGLAADVDYVGNDGYLYQNNYIRYETNPSFNQLKLGFLDSFDKNELIFWIDMKDDGYTYSYRKNGAYPNDIVIPEKPSFSSTGETVYDFSFTTSSEYVYRSTSWYAVEETGEPGPEVGGPIPHTTRWTVLSSTGTNPMMNEFPEELTSKFPNLNLEALDYQSTTLNLNSESYSDLINRQFIRTESESLGNIEYESEALSIYLQ